MSDHPEIWLEPKAEEYGCEGRLWCQDNVWGDEAVHYVLAAESDRLREALEKIIKCDEYWGGSAGEVAEIARVALALRLEDFGAISDEALAKEAGK